MVPCLCFHPRYATATINIIIITTTTAAADTTTAAAAAAAAATTTTTSSTLGLHAVFKVLTFLFYFKNADSVA